MIASATTPRVGRSAGQIALIVFGSLAGLVAVALLVGGGVLLCTKRNETPTATTRPEPRDWRRRHTRSSRTGSTLARTGPIGSSDVGGSAPSA